MSESDTPRTDAMLNGCDWGNRQDLAHTTLCRELERELAASQSRISDLEADCLIIVDCPNGHGGVFTVAESRGKTFCDACVTTNGRECISRAQSALSTALARLGDSERECGQLSDMLHNVAVVAFNLDDTIGGELYDKYLLRKIATLRAELAERTREQDAAHQKVDEACIRIEVYRAVVERLADWSRIPFESQHYAHAKAIADDAARLCPPASDAAKDKGDDQ